MIVDENDEVTYTKILAAAEEIRDMARHRPAQSAAMFAQARHLFELAEQMRNDSLRRRGAEPAGTSTDPEPEGVADDERLPDRRWHGHSEE